MRIFFVGLITVGLLTYCSESKNDTNLIEAGTIMTSDVLDTCLCESLTEDSLGDFYNGDDLFTGVCIYNYPDTDIQYMVKSMLNGKLHGAVSYFDRAGGLLVEETYENGTKKRTGDGAPLDCNCSELKQVSSPGETITRSFLEEIPYTGTCTEKFPETNQTYMRVTYESGIRNGFTIYYDRTGNTLYMEKYENGELIKVIHE